MRKILSPILLLAMASPAFGQVQQQPVVVNGGGGASPITHCIVGTVATGTCPMPVSGSFTPSGTQDVNLKQVGGAATDIGTGASGLGTQRITAAQDITTIAGSAPGTAGTPSINVISVQGVSGGTGVTVTQGTAAAVSAGWPTTNGEPADTTGTFTNATQTGNVTTPSVDGYATAIITISGTYNTATATFLASDDAGTTFYALACNRIDNSSAPELGYTGLTNTNRAWLCATQGFDQVRVLSSAVTSGTVNVRISQSAAPIQAPAQQATAPGQRTIVTLDIKTVTTGGTAVNAISAGNRTAGGLLCNPVGATINLGVNEIGTAAGTTSSGDTTFINPGQCYVVVPATTAVSVITSDSSHPYSGYGLK